MRHLFGPIDGEFSDQILEHSRIQRQCLTFGLGADIDIAAGASWVEVERRLPESWRPAFIALWLSYAQIPEWVWSCPLPIVGLAADWNLLWHQYRGVFSRLELILTDEAGVAAMHQAGFPYTCPGNLFGLERPFVDESWEETARDIDVLFVGNLQPAVQAERLPWLALLTEIGERWNVHIASGVFDAEYRALLRRSRIVFNRSIRGECNKRTFEGPACGALLFQEAENREVPRWLEPDKEYVPYTAETLLPLLEEFLSDEPRRLAIAEAGRLRVQHYSFDEIWSEIVDKLRENWPEIESRARTRLSAPLTITPPPALPPVMERMADVLQLSAANRVEPALRLARSVLLDMDRGAAEIRSALDVQPWPQFDTMRVEWEKAAWSNAGNPDAEAAAKVQLLRWRLHLELAQLSGDIAHYYEAVMARPDLPISQAALGCALARQGRLPEGLPRLREAVARNPFDLTACRAYGQLLQDTGLHDQRSAFCRKRRLLSKSAPGMVPAESWFMEEAANNALASIVVLCCNEVESTQACLESVRRHTKRPYELILIDNGSTDATPSLLDAVKSWPDPVRVEVIRNDSNRGYAAGVNQGIAAAKGEWLVMLNNDTIVTPHWLADLIRVAVSEDAALVGPVSNYAPEPQQVARSYADVPGLDVFAAARRSAFEGKTLDHPRLTGFCLLAHRQALQKVGVLDEAFGTGFFEDDDLCLRIRKAGLKLRVALGVYIHHEGSRTFRSLGIDTATLLQENLGKFREKWGDEEASHYRAPTAPSQEPPTFTILSSPLETPRQLKPGVTLMMIVKNEEQNLPACLESAKGLFAEIVIADTGSTDRTREIAESFGARIVEFPWIDHFAAARNAVLTQSQCEWVFWMDADDRLDEFNRDKLVKLFTSLPDKNIAYSMKCHCIGDVAEVVDHVRLFRNDARLRWQFRVHEQILPGLRQIGAELEFSDVQIRHDGYVDAALRAKKLQRNLRLLQMDNQEQPNHPYILFNLGSSYREMGQPAEALPYLRRSLELSQPGDSIVRKLYALIAHCHFAQNDAKAALATVLTGRQFYPDDPELLFAEGRSRMETGDATGAESCFRRLVDGTEDGDHFASFNPALRGHLGRCHLAQLLFDQKRYAEAEAQWRVALTEEPTLKHALLGLGDLYLQTKKWDLVEPLAQQLGEGPDADVLRGRVKLARKEFAAARWTLSEAAERFPKSVRARVYLSHALLQEGKDWGAAEQALRDVLNLDPQNVEAKNNLEVLLREHPKR